MLALLFFLSLIVAPAPPPSHPVRVVFVEPTPLDEAAHAPLRAEVNAALAYWQGAPCAPTFPIISEAAVTIPDAHEGVGWLNDLAQPGVITIAIVTTPGMVDLGGYGAYGYHREWGDHVLFAVAGGMPGASLGAIVAHELGHAFGLPHLVDATPKDLMEFPEPAYSTKYLSAADVAAVCAAPAQQALWKE